MSDAPSETGQPGYGEPVAWQPDAPRLRIVHLVLGWIVAAAAVALSIWIVPGTDLDRTGAAFLVAALIGVLNAVLPPVLAALRLPFMLVTGFLLVLAADAAVLLIAGEVLPDDVHVGGFGGRAAGLVADRRGQHGPAGPPRHERRERVQRARHAPGRAPPRRARGHRRPGHHLPGDRRARAAGAASGDARRQRAEHGALDRRRRLPPRRVGDGPVLADGRQPGRDPARLQRGHPGVPLGREGARADARVLLAVGLRRDRAPPRHAASGC